MTMNGAWKNIWLECIHNFARFAPTVTDLLKDIVKLSHTKVDEDDVQELLDSHQEPLTNKELMQLMHVEQDHAH